MEEFNRSDSSEMNVKDNLACSDDFHGMLEVLEDEDHMEEMNCSIGKKKRLTIDQVQALEKIFEVDTKLDQERKIKLAYELGLQPRQVAIWFQNRRARWKTKQLERDYRLLKANYEALQLNYSKVEQEKEGLVAELRGLKEKVGDENIETSRCIEKALPSHSPQSMFPGKYNDSTETEKGYRNHELHTNIHLSNMKQMKDFKEGLSDDSDSSGILNEDSYFNTQPMTSRLGSCSSAFDGMDQSAAAFSLSTSVYHHPPSMDPRGTMMRTYPQQFVMMEEQNFFNIADDSCNILPIDQTPLFWYFSDQRN